MLQSNRPPHAGDYLRQWRQRRRLSQLDLALDAEISQRHLSFLESGRATPSRHMLLHLADHLEVPLRERNAMLLSAGFAPVYAERSLDDPAMAAARQAVELVLKGHEPFPALAIDRHWTLLAANRALAPLLANIGNKALLEPPLNVLRLSLHPEGLAPQIANLTQWRSHLLERLRRQIAVSGDGGLSGLLQELSAYPSGEEEMEEETEENGVFVPLRLRVAGTILSFLSTTTLFGTPRDITLSELAIEAFFPADAATAKALRS